MKDHTVMLSGQLVQLVAQDKSKHLENYLEWINDPFLSQFVLAMPPITREEENAWFDKIAGKKNSDIVFAIETIAERKHIGVIGLHGIDWIHRHATTGTLIGNPEYHGKGYGTDAKMLLLNYAFNALNLHVITSAVIDYNERSERYSLRCGYKECGRVPEYYFKNGKRHDRIILSVTKKDWDPLWRKYRKSLCVK